MPRAPTVLWLGGALGVREEGEVLQTCVLVVVVIGDVVLACGRGGMRSRRSVEVEVTSLGSKGLEARCG